MDGFLLSSNAQRDNLEDGRGTRWKQTHRHLVIYGRTRVNLEFQGVRISGRLTNCTLRYWRQFTPIHDPWYIHANIFSISSMSSYLKLSYTEHSAISDIITSTYLTSHRLLITLWSLGSGFWPPRASGFAPSDSIVDFSLKETDCGAIVVWSTVVFGLVGAEDFSGREDHTARPVKHQRAVIRQEAQLQAHRVIMKIELLFLFLLISEGK